MYLRNKWGLRFKIVVWSSAKRSKLNNIYYAPCRVKRKNQNISIQFSTDTMYSFPGMNLIYSRFEIHKLTLLDYESLSFHHYPVTSYPSPLIRLRCRRRIFQVDFLNLPLFTSPLCGWNFTTIISITHISSTTTPAQPCITWIVNLAHFKCIKNVLTQSRIILEPHLRKKHDPSTFLS